MHRSLPRKNRAVLFAVCGLLTVFSIQGFAREWSCPAGRFKVEGDLIAYDSSTVVIKKESGDLLALELKELCDKDRDFVKSKEESEKKDQDRNSIAVQTWTGKDGMKVRGQVISYGQRKVTFQRSLGKVMVDGKPFEDRDGLHQKIILKVLSHLEGTELDDQKALEKWAREQWKGKPKEYELSGVLMRLESGDTVPVPFFLFSGEDLEVLKPGWEHWLAKKESEESQAQEDLFMRASALAYQRDRAQQKQIEMVKLELLAANTGAVNVWQVAMVPRPGQRARPFTAMVTAQNSAGARNIAMRKYPGFVARAVRKASY